MESHGMHVLEFIENELKKLTENLEIYVEPQPQKADKFKELSEISYRTAFNCNRNLKGKFLPKLLIDGFEAEQIFQQCELLSKAALPKISRTVSNLNPKDITDAVSKTKSHSNSSTGVNDKSAVEDHNGTFSDDGSEAEEDYAFDDDSDSFDEMEEAVRNKFSTKERKSADAESISVDEENSSNDEEFGAEEDNDFDEDSDSPTREETGVKEKPAAKQRIKSYHSEVDDKFFKLSELDEYLKIEDLKEERKNDQDSDSDIDGDIDLFQDIPSDDVEDSDVEEMDPKKSSKDLMYSDFFDEPQSDSKRKDNFMENEDDDDSFNEMDLADDTKDLEERDFSDAAAVTSDENKNRKKSAYELEQERIRRQVQEYEKSLLEPAPWHLTGEVDASKRPADSLIHKDTEFDSNVKQDLLVDSTLNEKVENITIMAIRNEAFNDVERKFKPTEDVIAYKTAVALEQTKSKKGLAEVYEEEYLKKQNQNKQEEEEEPKHKEIKKLMDTLFPELYALFSHIPVPAIPELKIVSNLPAVTVEEVAPTKVSDATLLAPEEVKKKSGLIKSQTERTETDRKRERRKKKIHQKLKEKKRLEKLESQKGNPSAKVTKLEKIQALKKIKQHKNTKLAAVDDGGKIKSSKDFFSRLQDTVISKNKSKPVNTTKKKKK